MALKRDKYDIEFWDNDTIKRNQFFFSCKERLIVWMNYVWMKTLLWIQSKISIEEADCSGSWKNEQRKRDRNKKRRYIQAFIKKMAVLWIRQPEQVEQQVTPQIKILMWTYHNEMKKKN